MDIHTRAYVCMYVCSLSVDILTRAHIFYSDKENLPKLLSWMFHVAAENDQFALNEMFGNTPGKTQEQKHGHEQAAEQVCVSTIPGCMYICMYVLMDVFFERECSDQAAEQVCVTTSPGCMYVCMYVCMY